MNDLDNSFVNGKGIGKTIATKVPINVHDELVDLVECGAYLSVSDFLREAIREHLKTYKVANMRDIDYEYAKKEVVSYFIKYKICFLDEIAVNLEMEFELVNTILNDLIREEKIVTLSKNHELFEEYMNEEMENGGKNFTNNGNNFIKFEGKRIIVESASKDADFICLRPKSTNSVFKTKGMVLNNGTVILSECYMYVG